MEETTPIIGMYSKEKGRCERPAWVHQSNITLGSHTMKIIFEWGKIGRITVDLSPIVVLTVMGTILAGVPLA